MNYRTPAAREQGLEEDTICTIREAESSERLRAMTERAREAGRRWDAEVRERERKRDEGEPED